MERGAASNTILITIGVAMAILVGVSIFFAVQPPTQFDPHSPQGTVQGYFQAIEDGDEELAETFLTEDLREACGNRDWHDEFENASRVVITNTEIEGRTASVAVNITISYGDEPFGGGSYDEDDTIAMEQVGDVWLISKPTWPMDHYGCDGGDF